MNDYLILISLGPVQDFIAQARRTRDLWFGSHILSELSRAVAKSMAEDRAKLVFPALDIDNEIDNEELQPCLGLLREKTEQSAKKSPLNIANKILATLPKETGLDPSIVAEKAREAARGRWKKFSDDAKEKAEENEGINLLAPDIDSAWDEQIDSLIEFFAVWSSSPIGEEEYAKTLEMLNGELLGRKTLREFSPWIHQREGVPKSSLDGARETVMADPKNMDERERSLFEKKKQIYRITSGEHLDAVGLVKRIGGEPEQFVPLGNVALASWIEKAEEVVSEETLKELVEECTKKNLGNVHRPDIPWTKKFTSDAQVFLPDRWPALLNIEAKIPEWQSWGKKHVRDTILNKMKTPNPYVACLAADGDQMGQVFKKLKHVDSHRRVSKAMADFAVKVRTIVEHENRGLLIYSGGDDVLAFMCLTDALKCADTLRTEFKTQMDTVLSDIEKDIDEKLPRPTLSVGIGVGHLLVNMRYLLDLGREAEKIAKGSKLTDKKKNRNALCVLVDKRSGGRSEWRSRWDDWDNDKGPANRLIEDAKLLGTQLSHKKVFQIKRDLDRFPKPDVFPTEEKKTEQDIKDEQKKWCRTLAMDVARTLKREQSGGSAITPEDARLNLDQSLGYKKLYENINEWVERMLVARAFSEAEPRARK